ncbi:type II toxin-antitoxin system death-on-curing family toxin [uncultured Ruegeria sp.]|uniref:type II toxin-antitoxin system death-on-curing family toxin n=1 Tax=uncultured Ruegeria sp. TaxID=259304 RepID=UPI00261299D6|nr:type II toxin-antitoxin system death-on-curing family toxin [uncultured Ruegeria sp.]
MADAIAAHDEALTFGGRDGVASLDLVESALGRPYSGYHRSISRKAAALLQSMIGNHGFVDGNKRTAWLVVEILIERSGYCLEIDDDEPIDDLVVAVAAGELGFVDLHAWFKGRLKRVS